MFTFFKKPPPSEYSQDSHHKHSWRALLCSGAALAGLYSVFAFSDYIFGTGSYNGPDELYPIKTLVQKLEANDFEFNGDEEQFLKGVLVSPYVKDGAHYVRMTLLPINYKTCSNISLNGLNLDTKLSYKLYVSCHKGGVSILNVDLKGI